MISIFRNANRKDMIIEKRTIDTHFNRTFVPPKGRGKFIKKIRDDMYASCWQYLIKKICLTILILLFFNFFLALSKIVKEMSSWDTYGSFRQDFLADKTGKLIKTDRVFFNIYEYWG